MRYGALFPFVLFATFLIAQQTPAPDPASAPAPAPQAPPNLTIPAKLSKTVSTEKSKRGDEVEFRTLEPVLIGQGVVMPQNTKLHGRVLGLAPRQPDKPSWLVILVESAEWKDHTLPLRAFISSQINFNAQELLRQTPADTKTDSINQNATARNGAPGRFGQNASARLRPPADASVVADDEIKVGQPRLDDVRLMRDDKGMVFLMSQKPNLKLPAGTMFMLQQAQPSHPPGAPVQGRTAQ